VNTLIQISDCHIDDNPKSMGVDTHSNLKKIIDKITTVNFDTLLISGDLAHNGTPDLTKHSKKFYRHYKII